MLTLVTIFLTIVWNQPVCTETAGGSSTNMITSSERYIFSMSGTTLQPLAGVEVVTRLLQHEPSLPLAQLLLPYSNMTIMRVECWCSMIPALTSPLWILKTMYQA